MEGLFIRFGLHKFVKDTSNAFSPQPPQFRRDVIHDFDTGLIHLLDTGSSFLFLLFVEDPGIGGGLTEFVAFRAGVILICS